MDRRSKSDEGASQRRVIAAAHAARIAPQSAMVRNHFSSSDAILRSASRRAPAAGGRCGPLARATDSSARSKRSNATPSIASDTSLAAVPSGNAAVLVDSAPSSAPSSAPPCAVTMGLCASQHPCALHDSRSPQSHTPPVSLLYMM